MKFLKELQYNTVANMLFAELCRQRVPLAEDYEEKERIIELSTDNILNEGTLTDIQEAVDRIKKYIYDTQKNYPDYFTTGKE